MKKMLVPVLVLTSVLMLQNQVFAQGNGLPDPSLKRVYTTKRIQTEPPVIDGRVDESVWNTVEWSGDFTQRFPTELIPPSERTEIKILYDEENLYIAARMYDTEPENIVSRVTRRDNTSGDMITILLDSNHDLRTAVRLGVTVSGVKLDDSFANDGDETDSNWDPVWYVKTSTDEQGWIAEMRIPFSQLRFSDQENQIMGLNFWRRFYRNNEYDFWQPIPQRVPGIVSTSGELHGIQGIKRSKKWELLPYTTGKLNTLQEETGNPFTDGRDWNGNLGMDGKLGLSGDFTLDFTFNPDFGQVEADPSEINLTAFETFFEEKRPFFIEGREIFENNLSGGVFFTGNNKLFHSRRIGSSPSYTPGGNYVDVPDNTSILGAVKLSGKTKNGLSIGILESVTENEKADVWNNGTVNRQSVEPTTNYFVSKVIKDFDRGNAILGVQLNAVNRKIDNNDLKFLPDAAYTGSLDFTKYWNSKRYFVSLNGMFSHLDGDESALIRTQRSSARYYQRPDNDYTTLDSSRTSLTGHGGLFQVGKTSSGNWNYSTGVLWYSPELEINDLGFLSNADLVMQNSNITYENVEPGSWYRSYVLQFNQQNQWNFGNDVLRKRLNVNGRVNFKNFWSLRTSLTYGGEHINTGKLRGGPGLKVPGRKSIFTSLTTNRNKKLSFHASQYFNRGNESYNEFNITIINSTWQPSNALQLSLDTTFEHRKDELQYVTTTSGNYLIGAIDQKTLILTVRANYSITPTLSLQYYGQPFVSAGDYTNFKRVTNARSGTYGDRFHIFNDAQLSFSADTNTYRVDDNTDGSTDYSFGNPDFNFRQFRSNMVVRWDYSPGSTFFLVWTQDRTGTVPVGSFSASDDLDGLFNLHPDNVFMIKFNKWFSF